jgi:2-phosphosulfolactate phosphatase
VIDRIGEYFDIKCDSSHMVHNLYRVAKQDLYEFMKVNDATHYHRLTNFGLEKDIRYCLTPDLANVLPFFKGDRLVIG